MSMLNECVVCSNLFNETKQNPGCICVSCREDIQKDIEKARQEAKDIFWAQLELKLNEG